MACQSGSGAFWFFFTGVKEDSIEIVRVPLWCSGYPEFARPGVLKAGLSCLFRYLLDCFRRPRGREREQDYAWKV